MASCSSTSGTRPSTSPTLGSVSALCSLKLGLPSQFVLLRFDWQSDHFVFPHQITTLTNVISFAIGCGMPTPEVRLFCAGAAIALTTVYLLHLLVFCPVLQLTAHLERKCNNKSVSNVQKQQGGAEIPNPDLLIIGKSIMTGTQVIVDC